ncbi:hypothetical protein [Niveibacterium sp. COAC-50]|uniref:hypothetical protein n=1 Tax=Niveibacterium sp. COAC-50 TaxID=2729384 RepID=UPI001551DB8A|nr:hypothetical protein [Niveibacterium sp. COAC-50]
MNRTNQIALGVCLAGLLASLIGLYRWAVPAIAANGLFATEAKAQCAAAPGCSKVLTYTVMRADGQLAATARFTLAQGKDKGAQRVELGSSVKEGLMRTADGGSAWLAQYRRAAEVEVRYER